MSGAKTLTEFLLARIAEDELHVNGSGVREPQMVAQHPGTCWLILQGGKRLCIERWFHLGDPARVLAECEAKRQIVEQAETVSGMDAQIEGEWGTGASIPWNEDQGVWLLRALALPYAEHPDYQQEWAL